MASIKNIFLKGVETIFGVFSEAVKTGTYSLVTDNGFDDSTTASDSIRCIFEKFTAKDVESLSFSELIQPQDVKGLVPCVDFAICEVSTKGTMLFGTDEYSVEGYDLDPMSVIYTFLLRKV